MRRLSAAILGVSTLFFVLGVAQAKVFFSKKGALEAVFPEADAVDQANLFLSEGDVQAIAAAAGTPWKSRLTSVYVGKKGGEAIGYAFIDTHKVRSLDETLMVVLGPDGAVRKVVVLAFHEPMEYLAHARWLAQFAGRQLDGSLSMRAGGVDGISGATLTARAVTASVRRVLALHQRKVAAKSKGTSRATGGR